MNGGRTPKTTVDFFPHDAIHSKSMFVLEQRYPVIGYSVWFKLLEQLASHENHYIDCDAQGEWEFLVSKLLGPINMEVVKLLGITVGSEGIIIPEGQNYDAEKCPNTAVQTPCQLLRDILNLLADLGSINKPNWQENVIFSENFVDRIKDVYDKRHSSPPLGIEVKYEEDPYAQVSVESITKVNKTKLNKIILLRLAPLEDDDHKEPRFNALSGITLWNSLCKWNNKKIPLEKLRNKLSVERVGLLKPCRGETPKITKAWKMKNVTEESWHRALNKYIAEIINRNPGNDYCNHRFSLQEFVTQANGYDKFFNR